ncbi:rho GTPase-activating protein 15-like isoform X2 [Limulus polyphemus]|uniref:Rho GTPase-activating protein 15-like isoform X2 n=1 Tax=Limulus polyphemus TaxID=6850 RepID=A0ABM1B830_LIMPO|nr:rho GTPase-activating protein 15-like isoform X2 [Limulus polyphemus]XP_022244125.1 rho GTPase-activating protein 15-like isoform X2 [Limulus polyphemus]
MEQDPIYANLATLAKSTPPFPGPKDHLRRILLNHWAEYEDETGRLFYYNRITRAKSWDIPGQLSFLVVQSPTSPKPFQKCESQHGDNGTDKISSSETSINNFQTSNSLLEQESSSSLKLPPGWLQRIDGETGDICYVNDLSSSKWFSSLDDNGRPYYYEDNGMVSFWQLPDFTKAEGKEIKNIGNKPYLSPCDLDETDSFFKPLETMSLPSPVLDNTSPHEMKFPAESFFNETLDVKKGGILMMTKVEEGGKRLKKNWSSYYVALTDVALLCYKDVQSTIVALKDCKAESCVNLAGAAIYWCPEKSSKKNVFLITTILGQKILFQDDSFQITAEWYQAIQAVISKLPSSESLKCDEIVPDEVKENLKSEPKKKNRFLPSRSPKLDQIKETNESVFKSSGEKKKIHNKLRNFFNKRPSMESLKKKGILKDEPVFGYSLQSLCEREKTNIPNFVQRCIEQIEQFDLTTDGIYRISGNLAQIQKLRLHVDQDDYSILQTTEDIHILTGALKLFFREMKEPLIPVSTFSRLLEGLGKQTKEKKLATVTEVVQSLPKPNYETLKFLLDHLLRVEKHQQKNLMDIQNLAIVFGPSLMNSESNNMALDVMQQNRVLEYLLLKFDHIFSTPLIY